MSEQENNQNNNHDQDSVIEAEAVEVNHQKTQADETGTTNHSKVSNEVLTRILVTLLFALIGWVSLWVFGVVVLVQFGFLLITGELNKNLKAFNGELGNFLSDIINYVSFQHDEKPFPFQGWHYDDDKKTKNAKTAR